MFSCLLATILQKHQICLWSRVEQLPPVCVKEISIICEGSVRHHFPGQRGWIPVYRRVSLYICICVVLCWRTKFHLWLLTCSILCPQVKVMVRVCPVSQSDPAESSSFLKVDPRKKQITIMDPSANQTPSTASQKRAGANQVPPKMFTFDAAFPPDASQVIERTVGAEDRLSVTTVSPTMSLKCLTVDEKISVSC